MQTMKKILLLHILFLGFFTQSLPAQQLQYDILWFGKIGSLKIDKHISNDSITIETLSEVRIPFYRFKWITTSTSFDGLLINSSYRQLINDDKREYTSIIFQQPDHRWHISQASSQDSAFVLNPCFFVSELYYTEPKGEKTIFSERFGSHLLIQQLEAGHYRLILPDNNYCDYFYENGVCVLVKAKNGRKTIKMKLSSTS